MSDPIRYAMSWGKDEDGSIYVSPTEQPKGNWVKYEDYARLQADVERLTKGGDRLAELLDTTIWWGKIKKGKQP